MSTRVPRPRGQPVSLTGPSPPVRDTSLPHVDACPPLKEQPVSRSGSSHLVRDARFSFLGASPPVRDTSLPHVDACPPLMVPVLIVTSPWRANRDGPEEQRVYDHIEVRDDTNVGAGRRQ
jgi:hypothetical protein